MRQPDVIAPARKPASAPIPRPKPTMIGVSAASRPGVANSRSESRVQMSTTLPYSGLAVPSMIPGISRIWRRTSKMIAPAARVTALIARPEKRKTTEAPSSAPTKVLGDTISRLNDDATSAANLAPLLSSSTVLLTASVNDPKSAVAARTAVAIAIPFVMAFVVLPTASRSVRMRAPAASMSLDISAMPWALSDTGPKVSIATMTPTVVNSPHPARAMKKSANNVDPAPSVNAP